MSGEPPSANVETRPTSRAQRSNARGPYVLLLLVGLGLLALAAKANLGRLGPMVLGAGAAMCLLVAVVLARRRRRNVGP